MPQRRLPGVVLAGLVLLLTACGQAVNADKPPDDARRGGTLRLLIPTGQPAAAVPMVLDPVAVPPAAAGELLKCCLLRTLYSYRGLPSEQGGATLMPDLAQSLPSVSEDGRTWTVKLREGLRYSPPYEEIPIRSADVVRSVSRALALQRPPSQLPAQFRLWTRKRAGFMVIEGAAAFAAGTTGTVAGFETPDDRTLRIRLDEPVGDLAERFSVLLSAPVPAEAIPPGPATGRLWVSSGPYMIEGAAALTSPSAVPAGAQPDRALILVRNPSWKGASDEVRVAYADRIELRKGGRVGQSAAEVDAGRADLVLSDGIPPQAPPAQIEKYRSDPELRERLHINVRDTSRAVILNLAVPPLDDVHVRKAIMYAIDRAALVRIAGGAAAGTVARHVFPDSLENNLLRLYNPWPTDDDAGDPTLARQEMSESRYDTDQDGRCDAPACTKLVAMTFSDLYFPEHAASIAEDLARIGITLDVRTAPRTGDALVSQINHPDAKVPMILSLGLAKTYPSASSMAIQLSRPTDALNLDYSLLGATPEQLARWGYQVTSVPSIDRELAACTLTRNEERFTCWADVDQRLMEQVVPLVPYVFENYVRPVSANVTHYSFDQSEGLPALDRIAVR